MPWSIAWTRVIENIARYQNEVGREPRLVERMKMVRAWYADRANDGKWLFGPSKFVGIRELYRGGLPVEDR